MKNFQILLALALATIASPLQAGDVVGSLATQNENITYHFVSAPTENGWVNVMANLHGENITFDLPAFEEWSYNSRKKELCLTVDTTDHNTFTAISVQYLPSADWNQLVEDNEEWFCTCGGDECDCELIKFAHTEGVFSFNEDLVRRLDEVIWDKDKVEDKKTGETRFEGPVCKTTMIQHGNLFYLVMSYYKGSDTERRPELEAVHDRIASSIPAGCDEAFRAVSEL